jgi:hypothetical protein
LRYEKTDEGKNERIERLNNPRVKPRKENFIFNKLLDKQKSFWYNEWARKKQQHNTKGEFTMKTYNAMSDTEINERINELSNILNGAVDERWDGAYNEYCKLRAIQDERYRTENQVKFNAFYEKHIKGKAWEEIDQEAWDFYSDWHKDMYGYRPRTI